MRIKDLKLHLRRGRLVLACAVAVVLPGVGFALLQASRESEDEAINYLKSPANDPIASLQQKIDKGLVKLEYDSKHGYLPSVLKALGIPVSSQMLVFSKTSFQHNQISPKTPRALYFNDHTFIGWVQGGEVVEVATVDPQLGAVFYVLPQQKSGKPKFARQTYECLQCHEGAMTKGIPGHIMRSVFPRADGQPEFRAGTYLTTDQSPLEERWGGWYVTGKHGKMRHMGNVLATGADRPEEIDRDAGANVTKLESYFDTSPYLGKHSDIVALMVAEHETNVWNLITRANYQTRIALQYERMLNKELGRPADYRAESTMSRIRSVAEPLVQAMLFVKEAPLTDAITGTSGFSSQFQAAGPRDKAGRSLRQLDLKQRLFKYPCSFLIYSEAFDGLPPLAKEFVYRRLHEVLSGQDKSETFAHLSGDDREGILEILVDTKAEFAAWLAKQPVATPVVK
jgi:hypothetical protein